MDDSEQVMNVPSSTRYEFRKLLSETAQIQTWRAVNTLTKRSCAVKTAADAVDIDGINTVLTTSFKCQRRLRSPDIITCREKHLEQRHVFIEYPLLDTSTWQNLSPRIFWSHYPQSLIRVSSIADYLHAFELVHGDLKIENFLCCPDDGGGSRYALVDLDFLSPNNSKPGSRVFGTPDYIAPEIIANDRVVTQSDSFSLGVSLQHYLNALRQDSSLADTGRDIDPDRLANLINALCIEDFICRPNYLLSALRKHDLISEREFESAQRELLSKILLGRWVAAGGCRNIAANEIRKLVVTQSKLLGVTDGLFDFISIAMISNRRSVFKCISDALSGATIRRCADYWHIELDDDALLRLYENLESIGTSERNFTDVPVCPIENRAATVLKRIGELAEAGQTEYSFLKCRRLLAQVEATKLPLPDDLVLELLQRLAQMARRLNRSLEALEYLSRLRHLLPEDSPQYGQVLEDTVIVNHSQGRVDIAAALIEERLSKVALEAPTEFDLNLYRIRGWLRASQGDYVDGEKILEDAKQIASSLGYSRVLMLTHYSIGVMDWRRGRLDTALMNLEMSLNIAGKHNLLDKALPVLSTMTLLYTEMAEYRAAVKYGKMGVRTVSKHYDATYMSHLCAHIAYACTRMADFPKAHYWIQRYFDLGKHVAGVNHLVMYYSMEGFLYLNQGNLNLSRQSMYKALGIADETVHGKITGSLRLNLAEVAVQQGDSKACQEHTQAAREAFAKIEDLGSIAEVRSVAILWGLAYGRTADVKNTLLIVGTLIEHHCWYSAVRLLVHLIAAKPNLSAARLAPVVNPFPSIIASSPVPLFRALTLLLEAVEPKGYSSTGVLGLWKQALRETLNGKARFASLMLCRAIGNLYLERKKYRHAEKYFFQAARLAEVLSNRTLAQSCGELIQQAKELATDQAPLVESFHGVSEILKEIAHTNKSYRRLLQFALDHTGAERAVLLLRRRSGRNLYVAASLNCDSKSEEEITGISSGVTGRTIAEINPLIVDNALSDSRTKNYSSIVAHNILSVACIPLIHGEQQQGVLYLDHNTLPSLFSSGDIKYLMGISNFLSMIIATVQAYRGLSQTNIQLRQDLMQFGDTGSFITADPNTLEMFERLPEIAYAEAPVLIQGESGTGKEIICEMLHEGSRRSDGPLVKLNCAAITSTMVEGELFGIAKNAATGVSEREGKLSAANGGTLLLDEVADMPLDTQAKLLRALEYQQFEKVGSNRLIHTDIRFVCATNKDLVEMLREGKFRQDLYYRINTIVIEIPPLRDRPSDVGLLLEHFLQAFSVGRSQPRFDADLRHRLESYPWPGNVRELRNFVERCCILYPGRNVDLAMFRDYMASSEDPTGSSGMAPGAEKALIRRTLHETNWNQTQAANRLGMPLSTLRRKMRKYGLQK